MGSPWVPLTLLVLETLTSHSAGWAINLVSQTQRCHKPMFLDSPTGPLGLALFIRPPLGRKKQRLKEGGGGLALQPEKGMKRVSVCG